MPNTKELALKQEEPAITRNPLTRWFENSSLLLWLLGLSLSNKVSLLMMQLLLLVNGRSSNFIAFVEDTSQKAVESNQDTREDLTLLGARVFTLNVVVKPHSIEDAYKAPLRDQFLPVSGLLGNSNFDLSFIHKPTGFEEPKLIFKTALLNSKDKICMKIQDYLETNLDKDEEWSNIPVLEMVRRMMLMVIAEILLGIKPEEMAKVYEPLVESLHVFEKMWQNPNQMNPFVMFMLYQRLEHISNELHKHRQAAELPDNYAQYYKRQMNVSAIFLVASNLIYFITAAILHQGVVQHDTPPNEQQLDNLSREVATWRFRDSRIYRLDSGLFFSKAGKHQIAGQDSLPRSLTIIPQGEINDQRMRTQSLYEENGKVKAPELFGRGRPCPGAALSYAVVKAVLFKVAEKKMAFVPNTKEQADYIQYVENRKIWQQTQNNEDEPSVTGRWTSYQ